MKRRPHDPGEPAWRLDLYDLPRHFGLTLRLELVLVGIYNNHLHVLLIESGEHSALALPGAYLDPELSLERMIATLMRKLKLSASVLSEIDARLLGVYSDPGRDRQNLAIAVAYLVNVSVERMMFLAADDPRFQIVRVEHTGTGRRLVSTEGKDLLSMVSDHLEILKSAIDQLRDMLDHSMIAFTFLGPTFTMSGLRKVHEIILGRELEPIRFRKRQIGRIFPDGRQLVKMDEQRLTGGRPAQLYTLGHRRLRADETVGPRKGGLRHGARARGPR